MTCAKDKSGPEDDSIAVQICTSVILASVVTDGYFEQSGFYYNDVKPDFHFNGL
jgi:hypothetical protein